MMLQLIEHWPGILYFWPVMLALAGRLTSRRAAIKYLIEKTGEIYLPMLRRNEAACRQ